MINIVLTNNYQLTNFGGLMNCGSKDIFKNAPQSHVCTNAYDDVIEMVSYGIIKNAKT